MLGDGSGARADGWVRTWAADHQAKEGAVGYHAWSAGGWSKASTFGHGPRVTIWNASLVSPTLADEPKRVAKVWQPVDTLILSYGHRSTTAAIANQLSAIHHAVLVKDPHVNVVVMLQNPDPVAFQAAQQEPVQAVKRWAETNKLDTVNIYDAFVSNPSPRFELVEKGGSPTPTGSALWAKTFNDAIASA